MKIRERELAERAIDRIAESDGGVIRLTDGTPAPTALVERDNMVVVALPEPRRDIHNQRPLAGEPERGGGEKSALDTVGLPLPEGAARRHMRIALLLPVHRERVEEVLYLDGAREAHEHPVFPRRESGLLQCETLHSSQHTAKNATRVKRVAFSSHLFSIQCKSSTAAAYHSRELGLRLRHVAYVDTPNDANGNAIADAEYLRSVPHSLVGRTVILFRGEQDIDTLGVPRIHRVRDDAVADDRLDDIEAAVLLRSIAAVDLDNGAEGHLVGKVLGARGDDRGVRVRARGGRKRVAVGLFRYGVVRGERHRVARRLRHRCLMCGQRHGASAGQKKKAHKGSVVKGKRVDLGGRRIIKKK